MAGDWIKVENCLPDKPEVWQIAELLDMDADSVVGKLIRIWAWADQQTPNGNVAGVTKKLLDRIAGVTGFAESLLQVGWLVEKSGGFEFPNFERHNGKSAKVRANTRDRVKALRAKCNAPSVTKSALEKRREEKSIKEISPTSLFDEPVEPEPKPEPPTDADPAELVAVVNWWNRLAESGLVKTRSRLPCGEAVRKSWRRAMASRECRDELSDLPGIEAAIRAAPFVRGWLTLERLLGGRNDDSVLIVTALKEGRYTNEKDRGRADPAEISGRTAGKLASF